MHPPAVARRPGRRLLVFSPCVHLTSAHPILQQRNTICERFTTFMRRVVVTSSRGPRTRGCFTMDRRSTSRRRFTQTCRLPPVGGLLCCSPTTLTLRSPEAVPPTKVTGCKLDRRSPVVLRNPRRGPQHCLSGCKVRIHKHGRCSSVAVDTGTSTPTSDMFLR